MATISQPGLSGTLRRTLLLKVISKPQPSKEDVSSVIELTSSKVMEGLQAQSMTLYLVDGNGNEHKVSNPETIKTFMSSGMTVTKVIEEDITG